MNSKKSIKEWQKNKPELFKKKVYDLSELDKIMSWDRGGLSPFSPAFHDLFLRYQCDNQSFNSGDCLYLCIEKL